jgi:group I intron endonuclease
MPEIYEGNTGVYCIRNIRNGKRYVGSTAKDFMERWKLHRWAFSSGRNSSHLQNAWNKYGPRSFVFQILERCPPEKSIEREQWWIDYIDAANPKNGYNLSPTADSRLGMKTSAEVKARMSESQKLLCTSSDHLCMLSEKAKRQWADPEIRRRMQESMKRKAADPERRRAIIEEGRRQARDPQWLKNNADAVKRRTADPEWQRKNAEAQARRWAKWRAERGEQA